MRVCNVRPVCECVRSNYWIILKTFSQTHEKKRKNKLCLHYTNYVLTMYQNIHSQSYYVSLVSLWWIKQPLFVIVQYCSIFLSDFRSLPDIYEVNIFLGKLTISERKWMLPKVDLCSQPSVATLLIPMDFWSRKWLPLILLTWLRLFLNILGHQFLWRVLPKSDLV